MAEKNGPYLGWFFIALSVALIFGGIWMTVTLPDDERFGRLGIPAGVYGPIIVAVSVAVLIYGVVLVMRQRKRG